MNLTVCNRRADRPTIVVYMKEGRCHGRVIKSHHLLRKVSLLQTAGFR